MLIETVGAKVRNKCMKRDPHRERDMTVTVAPGLSKRLNDSIEGRSSHRPGPWRRDST